VGIVLRHRRKIQVVGGSTYTVSLPKEWAKSVGLSHGSEVVIEVMPDLTLRVSPGEKAPKERPWESEIEISPENIDLSFMKLVASYIVGYDVITVKCRGCPSRLFEDFVKLVTDRTIGLEVVEKNNDSIVFQCLVDVSTLSLIEVLKTITKLTMRSLEELEELLDSGNKDLASEILERDSLIDKLYLYGLRQLNQVLLGRINHFSVGLKSAADVMYLAIMLKFLERIADHVAEVAKDIARFNTTRELTKLLAHIKFLREKYIQLSNFIIVKHVQEDLTLLSSLIRDLRSIESSVAEVSAQLKFEGGDHLVRISAYLRDLVEILVDLYKLSELVSSG